MAKTLVIAEHTAGSIKPSLRRVITAARQLAADDACDILLMADADAQQLAEQAARLEGVTHVFLLEDKLCQHVLADIYAPFIANHVKAHGYQAVCAAASTEGKDLLPRVAALLACQMIADIIAIESPDRFRRPIYAGNAIATVQSHDPYRIMTVRTTAFDAVNLCDTPATITMIDDKAPLKMAGTTFVKRMSSKSERPELTDARIVISGGRGLQSQDNFKILAEIADKLNAAIGASRAAVDAGYAPNDWQVGQTGKIVAPELYIAVGISGAIQHLAGIKDAKVIVAINKDEEAPIFQIADYGLVADLFDVLPQLVAKL